MKKFLFAALFSVSLIACDSGSGSSSPTDPNTNGGTTDTTGQGYAKIMDSLMKPDAKGVFTDARDGHQYEWVRIGNFKVMTSNLAYRPKHGNVFLNIDAGMDSTSALAKYGYAYDYAAMVDSNFSNEVNPFNQGACPDGWWVPSYYIWDVIVQRPLIVKSGGRNSSVDAIFNRWAITSDEGGKDSLGLHFSSGYGIDFDCDTAEFFADSISNCKEHYRKLISYATADTSNYIGDVKESIIVPADTSRRYNAYKIAHSSYSTGLTSIGYGNSYIRRKFGDFSYIRCFQDK